MILLLGLEFHIRSLGAIVSTRRALLDSYERQELKYSNCYGFRYCFIGIFEFMEKHDLKILFQLKIILIKLAWKLV